MKGSVKDRIKHLTKNKKGLDTHRIITQLSNK